MTMDEQNLYSVSDHLSNIELYYTAPDRCLDNEVSIFGDDFQHITKVMRHKTGDRIYVTNGMGKIFIGNLNTISKGSISITILNQIEYKNYFENIFICIPKLKSQERFEFALEKCTELGITNFIVFESERTISKSIRLERWDKIVISAMKQSLRSFKPNIKTLNSIKNIFELEGEKIVFEQNSRNIFSKKNINFHEKIFFVFGPEGGLTENEINLFNKNNSYNLAGNRLRSETAIVKCASILSV